MVYHNQYIYPWHTNRLVFPNEKLSEEQKQALGYFVKHQDKWILVNKNLPDLYDVNNKKTIPVGEHVVLEEGVKLLMERGIGGRLIHCQMANSKK